jgi:hypothetical protein
MSPRTWFFTKLIALFPRDSKGIRYTGLRFWLQELGSQSWFGEWVVLSHVAILRPWPTSKSYHTILRMRQLLDYNNNYSSSGWTLKFIHGLDLVSLPWLRCQSIMKNSSSLLSLSLPHLATERYREFQQGSAAQVPLRTEVDVVLSLETMGRRGKNCNWRTDSPSSELRGPFTSWVSVYVWRHQSLSRSWHTLMPFWAVMRDGRKRLPRMLDLLSLSVSTAVWTDLWTSWNLHDKRDGAVNCRVDMSMIILLWF